MPWIVEMTGFDPTGPGETTLRFAMGPGVALEDGYALGHFTKWSSASQRIDFTASGRVQISGDSGELALANIPDDVTGVGPLDHLADWVWQNRKVSLYYTAASSWADKVLVAHGVLEQPVVNLSVSSGITSALRFVLRDPRAALETPLQPAKYAGTNVGPVGVEGGENLKGQPKPIIYGLVSNIAPPRVNDSLLIYQLADKAVTVLCVRDGGVSLTQGQLRASLAALQANDPASGTYDRYAGAEGTFIRLGTTPIFGIGVDADEATTEANQSHPNIWSRIRTERIASVVDAASVATAHALDGAGAGFYWSSEITQKDALAEVLGSFSGYELVDAAGTWKVAKLVAPAGVPKIEIVQLTPATRIKAKTRLLKALNRARPQYAPDGAPPYRVIVQWGRNYTTMAPTDFAGVVGPTLRAKFAEEYRKAIATDLTIWNPDTKAGPWKNAPELTIDTAYQPGADGKTSPGADAEAARLLALFKPMRGQYSVELIPEPGDLVDPGDVVSVTYPRMGMAAGPLFRVLEAGLTVEDDVAQADLVVGLQT